MPRPRRVSVCSGERDTVPLQDHGRHPPLPFCSPFPKWENSTLSGGGVGEGEWGEGQTMSPCQVFFQIYFFMLWVFLAVPEA